MQTLFAPFPSLTTERLLLRPLKLEDAPEMLVQRSDERILRFTEAKKAADLADATAFIEKIQAAVSAYWAICPLGEDKLIGTICLWNLNTEKQVAELGYTLHPDHWGKGLASEAVTAVIDFGFAKMGATYLEAGCMTGNEASIRLLKKQGFVKTGVEDKYEIFALCRPPLGQFLLETERLSLREITPDDAPFILELLNTPDWIANIGDRQVRNLDDARKYIIHRLFSAYRKFGFGFWLMERKTDGIPVGIAGLVKRDFLDDVDIGYALMPSFHGHGYAVEAAKAVLNIAKRKLALPRLAAITIESNKPSQQVLEKIGLRFERIITVPGDEEELMLWGIDL
ncbi:MAG: GNAT family N-acetyltransferase [Saprospiraceae bacterium]|nr:GNAT family N-acetyltransferase [Saprospiraceae bacterium]MCF8248391.1 GNAT family N-acetyltransferase [Saprospiraceae bacterium]MCF8280062.1 GNAT family N-acetyltransferase [Bacteroidales bacterium]MCF8309919.1 GNAT family N-acetyltransferase [Saprospiraceae bacterium]MCF8438750.1 GNAT family N-acetyltransferase [Saprospiraceae bacterium]